MTVVYLHVFFYSFHCLLKVDIDELTDLSLEHDVQAVPVLAAFKNGKAVNKLVGLQDTDIIRKWVKSHIE